MPRRPHLAALALAAFLPAAAYAADPGSCRTVRMSDPGWTDITSTNALAGVVLAGLGYKQDVQTIGVPITYQGLKTDQIDVFLGNWLPTQSAMIEPMEKAGEVAVLATNLDKLRFTLAVPNYVSAAGIKDFKDLEANGDKFDHKIYGIEAGSAVNQNVTRMLKDGAFGLKDWELVESSEQGMLAQVRSAVRTKDWIVFEAWEPHPMNDKFPLTYLTGGDKYFGPNLGEAHVRTVARRDFPQDCPNLTQLFRQMHFTVDMENTMMAAILDDGAEPKDAATAYLKKHPELLDTWLTNVNTAGDQPGLAAVKKELGL